MAGATAGTGFVSWEFAFEIVLVGRHWDRIRAGGVPFRVLTFVIFAFFCIGSTIVSRRLPLFFFLPRFRFEWLDLEHLRTCDLFFSTDCG